MIKKPKKPKKPKKVTKKKVSKQKSKSISKKKKVVKKIKNPTVSREERIKELKLKLKKLKEEMKGDDRRDPPGYGSTLWLIMSGKITFLENLIDDLNYTTDEEYEKYGGPFHRLPIKDTNLEEKNSKSKKRFSPIKSDDSDRDNFYDSELEKWHSDASDNLPSKKKNWF
jgi:hypothetical protein